MDALEYVQELDKCRGRLAEELDEEDVPDDVWGHVTKLGLVYGAITGSDDDSWQELVGEAKAYMKESREQMEHYRQPPGRGKERGAPEEAAVKPPENVTKRAEALAEVVATLCTNHPEVRRFRRRYLGGRQLTEQEARAFLDERGGPYGTNRAARKNTLARKRLIEGTEGPYRTPVDMKQLLRLAEKLSTYYPWQEGDALWFVLTGHVPPVRPLEVWISVPLFTTPGSSQPITARITVTAHAWVGAEVVERAFRDAQLQVLGGDAFQPKDERTLEVVKFVARRMRKRAGETWEERWKAWNRTCPEEWRYKTYNGFRQVYEERFLDQYVYRAYNQPNYELRERTPYEAYRDDWNDRITGRKEKRARRLAAGDEMHQ